MSKYTPTIDQIKDAAVATGYFDTEEADRAVADHDTTVRRQAEAKALRDAADTTSSQAAQQWRLDRGEGMPGGISKPGAQLIAQNLDLLARIFSGRADKIENWPHSAEQAPSVRAG